MHLAIDNNKQRLNNDPARPSLVIQLLPNSHDGSEKRQDVFKVQLVISLLLIGKDNPCNFIDMRMGLWHLLAKDELRRGRYFMISCPVQSLEALATEGGPGQDVFATVDGGGGNLSLPPRTALFRVD